MAQSQTIDLTPTVYLVKQKDGSPSLGEGGHRGRYDETIIAAQARGQFDNLLKEHLKKIATALGAKKEDISGTVPHIQKHLLDILGLESAGGGQDNDLNLEAEAIVKISDLGLDAEAMKDLGTGAPAKAVRAVRRAPRPPRRAPARSSDHLGGDDGTLDIPPAGDGIVNIPPPQPPEQPPQQDPDAPPSSDAGGGGGGGSESSGGGIPVAKATSAIVPPCAAATAGRGRRMGGAPRTGGAAAATASAGGLSKNRRPSEEAASAAAAPRKKNRKTYELPKMPAWLDKEWIEQNKELLSGEQGCDGFASALLQLSFETLSTKHVGCFRRMFCIV